MNVQFILSLNGKFWKQIAFFVFVFCFFNDVAKSQGCTSLDGTYWINIGNPGNPPDGASYSTMYEGAPVAHSGPAQVGRGSVNYSFWIDDKFAVFGDYIVFLNAVDPFNTKSLATGLLTANLLTNSGGVWSLSTAGNCPTQTLTVDELAKTAIHHISFYQACHYANWKATGNIDSGAYSFVTPNNGNSALSAINTSWTGPRLLTEDEWYKAAYWDQANLTYNLFGTTSLDAQGHPIQSGVNAHGVYTVANGAAYDVATTDGCYLNIQAGQGGTSAYGVHNMVGDYHSIFLPNGFTTSSTDVGIKCDNMFGWYTSTTPAPGTLKYSSAYYQTIPNTAAYPSPSFRLASTGSPYQACCFNIDEVATCVPGSGSITITTSGIGPFEYSIDGGTTFQSSNVFTGITASVVNVVVRIQGTPNCYRIFKSNPVVLNCTTPCTAPSAITFSQVAPTCTGATANDNGTISLATATNGTHFGISTLNAASYDGPITVAGATAIGALPMVIQSSIPNTGGTYRVRIFNGADGCFTDQTVTVNAVTCTCPTPNCGTATIIKN